MLLLEFMIVLVWVLVNFWVRHCRRSCTTVIKYIIGRQTGRLQQLKPIDRAHASVLNLIILFTTHRCPAALLPSCHRWAPARRHSCRTHPTCSQGRRRRHCTVHAPYRPARPAASSCLFFFPRSRLAAKFSSKLPRRSRTAHDTCCMYICRLEIVKFRY